MRGDPHVYIIIQEERLWIADPKAIHYILQGTSYVFEKPRITRELHSTVLDMGLVTVEGELSPIFDVG